MVCFISPTNWVINQPAPHTVDTLLPGLREKAEKEKLFQLSQLQQELFWRGQGTFLLPKLMLLCPQSAGSVGATKPWKTPIIHWSHTFIWSHSCSQKQRWSKEDDFLSHCTLNLGWTLAKSSRRGEFYFIFFFYFFYFLFSFMNFLIIFCRDRFFTLFFIKIVDKKTEPTP